MPSNASGIFQRIEMEQTFMEYLWQQYLFTTIPLDEDQVRLEVVSEVLKVLLSPYMRKQEKVLLLQTI